MRYFTCFLVLIFETQHMCLHLEHTSILLNDISSAQQSYVATTLDGAALDSTCLILFHYHTDLTTETVLNLMKQLFPSLIFLKKISRQFLKMISPYYSYATGDQQRNNSRKNEGMEPKQKQHPVEDVTGDRSKVQCCKEQYCIGTWNVRSVNQGKVEVVKQEMARVNVNILGISELKWTGMGEF